MTKDELIEQLKAQGITEKKFSFFFSFLYDHLDGDLFFLSVVAAFEALEKHGINLEKNKALYESMLDVFNYNATKTPYSYSESYYANKLNKLFKILSDSHVTIENNPSIFECAISNLNQLNEEALSECLRLLDEFHASPEANPVIFETLLSQHNLNDAEMRLAFERLKNFGVTIQANPELFLSVIKCSEYKDKLSQLFDVLEVIEANPIDYPKIFKLLITNLHHIDKAMDAFEVLKIIVANPNDYPELFEQVISNLYNVDMLALAGAFEALELIEANPIEHPALFEHVIHSHHHIDKLSTAFEALKAMEVNLKDYPKLFEQVFKADSYADKLALAFKALAAFEVNPNNNPELFNQVIAEAVDADKLALAFNALAAMGTNPSKNSEFFNQVIAKAVDADKLALAYNALAAMGANPNNSPELFNQVTVKSSDADKLALAFKALKELEVDPDNNPELYNQVIANSRYADSLALAFKALAENGANPNKYPELFNQVIEAAPYGNGIALAFDALKAIHANPRDHFELFEAVIKHRQSGNSVQAAFEILMHAGATLNESPALFKQIIEFANFSNKLEVAFNALQAGKITPKESEALFTESITHALDADKHAIAFHALNKVQANPKDNPELYAQVFTSSSYDSQLEDALDALSRCGVTVKEHSAFIKEIIRYESHAGKLAIVFNALAEAKTSPKIDEAIFAMLIERRFSYNADLLAASFRFLFEHGATINNAPDLFKVVVQTKLSANDLENMEISFNVLASFGASPHNNAELFVSAISYSSSSEEFSERFNVLLEHKATLQQHAKLFNAAIYSKLSRTQLDQGFQAVKTIGATLDANLDLFEQIIESRDTNNLAATFKILLEKHQATLDKNPELFKVVIQSACDPQKIEEVFATLGKLGASLNEHSYLFLSFITKNYSTHQLDQYISIISLLLEQGANFTDHASIFEQVIKQGACLERLQVGFAALKELDFNLTSHLALFQAVIAEPSNSYVPDEFVSIFKRLQGIGLDTSKDLSIIQFALKDTKSAKKILDLFDWLESKKITFADHPTVYNAFFLGDSAAVTSPTYELKLKSALEGYLQKHPLLSIDHQDFETQVKEIQKLVYDTLGFGSITEGPLNRSDATIYFQEQLQRIADEPIENIEMRYESGVGYILKFKDEPDLYLSQLIPFVNFNHIHLTEEQINIFDDIIAKTPAHREGLDSTRGNDILQDLPQGVRNAIHSYVSRAYLNINRLFRGIPQSNDATYQWVSPVEGKANLIACFLTGCILNWTAAELPRKLYANKNRQLLETIFQQISTPTFHECQQNPESYATLLTEALSKDLINPEQLAHLKTLHAMLNELFPSYRLSVRRENLSKSQSEEPYTLQQRMANPVTTPSITSVSVQPDGSPYFNKPGTITTKFENRGYSRHVMINKTEGEYILPSGTTLIYTRDKDSDNLYFAEEVNSPGITIPGDAWSAFALAEAFKKHLSKPYQLGSNQTQINGVVVQRPNHGLAHEYRMQCYIDVVIDYFAHQAKDEQFRLFCQQLSTEERSWLRVAAAFSITGRESEIAAVDNLQLYDSYREACKTHMVEFLEQYPPLNGEIDLAMKERMLDVVRWMGNPFYETERNSPAQHGAIECQHRNFLHRILSIAHKLDLPRCYSHLEFMKAMHKCQELSKEHKPVNEEQKALAKEQEADYLRMIAYAINLNRAHGNALSTTLSADGQLVSCSESYRPPFERVSTSLREVRAAADTVSRPKLKESYQFPHTTDTDLLGDVLLMLGGENNPDMPNASEKSDDEAEAMCRKSLNGTRKMKKDLGELKNVSENAEKKPSIKP